MEEQQESAGFDDVGMLRLPELSALPELQHFDLSLRHDQWYDWDFQVSAYNVGGGRGANINEWQHSAGE